MQSMDGIIGFVHTLKSMGDKMVNWQFSLQVTLHQNGHITTTLETTKGSSLPYTTSHQLEGSGGNLMTRSGNSNHARFSPSTVSTFQCRPHHIDVPRTIERIVHTPWCHFSSNNLLNGLVNLGWTGINAIGCAQFLGHFKLVRINVNGNNLAGSGHLGTLNDSESHSTKPKDSHTRICFHIASIPNRTQSSRYSTTKETCLGQCHFFGNLGARNFGQNRIFTHGTASHEMKDILTILIVQTNRTIGHDTLPLSTADLWTQVGFGAHAENARGLGTLRSVAGNDVISWLHRHDTRTNRFHDTSRFVSQNTGKQAFWIEPIQSVDIRMAKSIGNDLDANLAFLGRIHCNFFFRQRLLGASGHHGLTLDRFAGSSRKVIRATGSTKFALCLV
mmetsp:Transcript_35090/g.84997  ORF Transcript_35090/g.84997 Transcript_35090/m.84997 type:complete len:389 (+) Transcript_35090:125-1291(+)